MLIDKDFEGGNIIVTAINGDVVSLKAELRDTEGEWFYWAFRVRGAQGRKVRFDFGGAVRVGYFGAAVSSDNIHWRWTDSGQDDPHGFIYTFGPDETELFFCHDMRYGTERFTALTHELCLSEETFALSEKGRPIPFVRLGRGPETVLITSRHHCCESTGTFLLEGVLRELIRKPLPDFTVLAIPFMDIDGVIDGDQGKNRRPHDHNRDYDENPIYSSVRAVLNIARNENVAYVFDLHSPWHSGGSNDVCSIVQKNGPNGMMLPRLERFGRILEQHVGNRTDAFRYDKENDMPPNTAWNTDTGKSTSCSGYFPYHNGIKLALSLETPYFGKPENRATEQSLTALGECLGLAIRDLAKIEW